MQKPPKPDKEPETTLDKAETISSGVITENKCECSFRDNYNECRESRKKELFSEEKQRRQQDRQNAREAINQGVVLIQKFADTYESDKGTPKPDAIDFESALPSVLIEPPNSLIEDRLDKETFDLCADAFKKTNATDLYEQYLNSIRTIEVLGDKLNLSTEVIKREPEQVVEKIECKNDWLNYWLPKMDEKISPLRKFSPELRDAVTQNYSKCKVEQNYEDKSKV